MNKAALLIAVPGNEPHLKTLKTPENNIQAVYEILINPKQGGFDKDKVKCLTFPNTTTTKIWQEIKAICEQKCDLIFLYFSGHGVTNADDSKFYLTTQETCKDGEDFFPTTILLIDEVATLLNKSSVSQQVIVLDCCLSGKMGMNLTKMQEGLPRAVFTSATALQNAFESEGYDYSNFSYCFIEGLKARGTTESKVTVRSLWSDINRLFNEHFPKRYKPELFAQTAITQDIVLALTEHEISAEQIYREKVLETAEANKGDIPVTARYFLEQLRDQHNLTPEQTAKIEATVLEPIRIYHGKLQRFEQALRQAVEEAEGDGKKSLSSEVRQLTSIANLQSVNMAEIIYQVTQDLQKRSRFQIAIILLEIALDLDKSSPLVYLGWGDCLLNQGKLQEAIEKYNQALNLDPYLAEAHWGKGEVSARQNQNNDAIICFREARNLNRQLIKVYHSLAKVLEAQGYPQAAMTELERALQINPDDPVILSSLSRLLEEQGKVQEANQTLQRVKLLLENIVPNSEDAELWTEWGSLLFTLRELRNSKNKFEQALKLNPYQSEARAGLGNYYYYQGDMDSPIVYYEEALRLNPSLSMVYHNLGYIYLARNSLDEAIKQFENGLAITPNYAILHRGLAEVYMAKGDYDQAAKFYESAIRLNPGSRDAYFGLANLLNRRGQDAKAVYERVIRSYEEVIKINPNNAEAYQILASVYENQGELEKAIIYRRKVIELLPEQFYSYRDLGFVLLQFVYQFDIDIPDYQEKINEAEKLFHKALELNERDPNIYSGQAQILQSQEKYPQALAKCEQALLLEPTLANVHNIKGNILLAQNRITEAIASYNKALEFNSNEPWFYHNLGNAYFQQENWEKAEEYFSQAIDLNANEASFHNMLGICYNRREQPTKAITCYQKAIELSPQAVFYHNLGYTLQNKGDFEAARNAFRDAVKLEPNNANYHKDLGSVLCSLNYWDEAIVAFQESINQNSESAAFFSYLGYALQQRNHHGDLSEAIRAYSQAVEIDGNSWELHFLLGKALKDNGNLEQATEHLQKAKSLAEVQNQKDKIGEIEKIISELLFQKTATWVSEKASETASSIAEKASNLWKHLF